MNQQEALFKYALYLGDNALIMGHRISEWCSKGPMLEEDIALSNLALDYLGQATALLKYAAQTEGKGRTEDDLAYKRPEREFLNNLIVELPNGDFAYTMAKIFFYSSFLKYFYQDLSLSKDETLSAIAQKSLKEIKYHVRHSSDWICRLGDGTDESHSRMQNAISNIWMYTGELFEMNEVDLILVKESIAVDLKKLADNWKNSVAEILHKATLTMPTDNYMQSGGRKGLHTEYLGYILAEMQYLPRAYPNAKW
jgi:ring-1,2-phenylacetyl-CoA epoxidase subunit PaaC